MGDKRAHTEAWGSCLVLLGTEPICPAWGSWHSWGAEVEGVLGEHEQQSGVGGSVVKPMSGELDLQPATTRLGLCCCFIAAVLSHCSSPPPFIWLFLPIYLSLSFSHRLSFPFPSSAFLSLSLTLNFIPSISVSFLCLFVSLSLPLPLYLSCSGSLSISGSLHLSFSGEVSHGGERVPCAWIGTCAAPMWL